MLLRQNFDASLSFMSGLEVVNGGTVQVSSCTTSFSNSPALVFNSNDLREIRTMDIDASGGAILEFTLSMPASSSIVCRGVSSSSESPIVAYSTDFGLTWKRWGSVYISSSYNFGNKVTMILPSGLRPNAALPWHGPFCWRRPL